ncbi:RluA family pseudouridine synthase [Azospirillum thermophilum]|uniref:RNA pseudouridine synthase n=1 Tax=Azospirillum thermophilum TaxID=2202148 RepID=A0A2S2CXS8_9PROT|nr:RNA pseudouridine synthase [Azospirillum thermophilum]AWK89291.1 RNA pseudouridine synthase [Azospirillum thermophilum]
MTPEEIQARVLYRDALMLILDKPAGLPVHAGPGGGPNLERYFSALRFGLPKPPALAHRLDRDTSGCLILGRHPKALRKLGILFQDGKVDKTYWAVVAGSPPTDAGRMEWPLKKVSNRTGGWRIVTAEDGQAAVTDYVVRGRGNGTTWLELTPHTGRTHQIRVHCAALGCPLLGDPQYGGPDGQPLHLHSRAISLPLYPKREPVGATAPVPEHMQAALEACGYREEAGA